MSARYARTEQVIDELLAAYDDAVENLPLGEALLVASTLRVTLKAREDGLVLDAQRRTRQAEGRA